MKSIYLMIGEEQSSILKRINRLIRDDKIDEFNVTTYDCEVDNYELAIEDALTIPFMSDNKVVIIKNPIFLTKNSQVKDYTMFIDYLKKPMETTALIINAGSLALDDKKEAVTLLKKKAETMFFKRPGDVELQGYLQMKCKLAGIYIKQEAVKKFFELIGTNNMDRIGSESDKLINYALEDGIITVDVVEKLVLRDYETDVFKLTNAIIKNETETAYSIYQDLILGTTDPVSLINQISSAMRNMYAVGLLLEEGASQSEIQSRLNIKSGYAYNLINNYKNMSNERLVSAINKLGELDYKIKSGKVNPKSGFEMFLLQI